MPVKVWTLPGRPLSVGEIAERIGLHDAYHWAVATPGQERERNRHGVAPAGQGAPGEGHLLFHRMLRYWLGSAGDAAPVVLRRVEERILVRAAARRAAEALLGTDADEGKLAAVASQIEQDAGAWAEALADLAARGVNLDVDPFEEPEAHEAAQAYLAGLVHPQLQVVVSSLQRTTTSLADAENAKRFEAAARDFVSGWRPRVDAVVMEGFTRLTPLQSYFIEVAARRVPVHVIVPYREQQDRGFEAVALAHGEWWETSTQSVLNGDCPQDTTLGRVQNAIFASEPIDSGEPDGSVTVEQYGHQDIEIASVLDRVTQYRSDAAYQDWRIAIVTADLEGTRTLLAEHDAARGGATGVESAQRLLLLTPLGRFVMVLYRAWDAATDRLSLDADAFYEALASGRLGAQARESAPVFAAVREQWFRNLSADGSGDLQAWTDRLDSLAVVIADGTLLARSSRLALHSVTPEHLACWRQTLDLLNGLCCRLFTDERLLITQHVERLVRELRSLQPEDLEDTERVVIDRIERALEDAAAASAIRVSADQFGTALIGLASDSEPGESRDARTEADLTPEPPTEPLADFEGARAPIVTTFEGIDGGDFDVVFIVGCNHHDVPAPARDSWPHDVASVQDHIAHRRYLFLSATRAASRRLHVSFARQSGDRSYRASPYVSELRNALGTTDELPITPPATTQAPGSAVNGDTPDSFVDMGPRTPAVFAAQRSSYSLHELAHHAMCPRRYALERVDPRAGRYTDAFHLRFLAEAVWIACIWAALEVAGEFKSGNAFGEQVLSAAAASESTARALFPGLRDLDWYAVKRGVIDEIEYLLPGLKQRVRGKQHGGAIVAARSAGYAPVIDGRTIDVAAPFRFTLQWGKGPYAFALYPDVQGDEWLRHGRKPWRQQETDAEEETERQAIPVHERLYDAIQSWRRMMLCALWFEYRIAGDDKTAEIEKDFQEQTRTIEDRIAAIELGLFPKNPGEREEACMYCPARAQCTGRSA